jgi:hypothetical protein
VGIVAEIFATVIKTIVAPIVNSPIVRSDSTLLVTLRIPDSWYDSWFDYRPIIGPIIRPESVPESGCNSERAVSEAVFHDFRYDFFQLYLYLSLSLA